MRLDLSRIFIIVEWDIFHYRIRLHCCLEKDCQIKNKKSKLYLFGN